MEDKERIAMGVSAGAITGNMLLAAFKLFAGIYGNSAALVSDAAHSLSDVMITVIVIIGVGLSGRKADKEHPYGHERMECVAAIILAMVLLTVGMSIGAGGVKKAISGDYSELMPPGALALAAAVISIAVKEAMYWYTRRAARKINSGALMADAWHHRSDSLSSVGSFAGILGARLGFPVLDPAACVVISFFVLKAAYDIFMDAIGKMTDRACDDSVIEEIHGVILECEAVLRVDQVKTRLFGDKIYVDVEISANADASLTEAHDTAQRVHDAIESRFPKVKHCMVHVNPL